MASEQPGPETGGKCSELRAIAANCIPLHSPVRWWRQGAQPTVRQTSSVTLALWQDGVKKARGVDWRAARQAEI